MTRLQVIEVHQLWEVTRPWIRWVTELIVLRYKAPGGVVLEGGIYIQYQLSQLDHVKGRDTA